MTSTNTAARKTYRTDNASTVGDTATDGRPGVPKQKSAGQKALMIVLFVFGVWRLTVGVMTLVGPSTTTSSHTSPTVDTSSVCYSNPAARGC